VGSKGTIRLILEGDRLVGNFLLVVYDANRENPSAPQYPSAKVSGSGEISFELQQDFMIDHLGWVGDSVQDGEVRKFFVALETVDGDLDLRQQTYHFPITAIEGCQPGSTPPIGDSSVLCKECQSGKFSLEPGALSCTDW
jgi:hypothetical protein